MTTQQPEQPQPEEITKIEAEIQPSIEIQSSLPEEPKELSCMERATHMVDGINRSLYSQILEGKQSMHRRKSLPSLKQSPQESKKKSIIVEVSVDIDQHKKMIRKFMRLNKRMKMVRQQRSNREIESGLKQEKESEKNRDLERSKTLELRRQQINERLKKKQEMMQEIRRSMLESSQRFQAIKSKKTLYQQKQEIFSKNYLLPKIEEEKRILKKIKEERQPLDIQMLMEHQKRYEQRLRNDRINRSLTSRVLEMENHYEPPKYVPKSFQILEAEQQLKREEERMKTQEHEINQYRKKQFLRMMEQKQKQQNIFTRSRSKKSMSAFETISSKQKPRILAQLTREEVKSKGNSYLKDLVAFNKKRKNRSGLQIKNKTQMNHGRTIEVPQPRTHYDIQLIREEQIQRMQTIKIKIVDDIVCSKKIDPVHKLERLNYENEKIDQMLSERSLKYGKQGKDEVTALYLSSIHTKLAILEVGSPRKAEQ